MRIQRYYLYKKKGNETNLVLRGISNDGGLSKVLGRLVEEPVDSSSAGSGAARFFPFGSVIGSFIVRAAGLRRALSNMESSLVKSMQNRDSSR